MRGAPYTPHWFIWHDADGRIDATTTYQLGGLPRSDVELANSVREMVETAGHPAMYGIQDKTWYLWNGSGRYGAQPVSYPIRMTKILAGWCQQAFQDVWRDVTDGINARHADPARRNLLKQSAEWWKPQKAFVAKIWNDAGQRAIRSQCAESVAEDCDLFDRMTAGKVIVDNGVIEYAQVVRDGYVELKPHDPSVLVTKRAGERLLWEPDAACPAFERFTRESVPDDDQRDWLLWRVAHTLFGNQPRKGFVNLIGARDSGKSTFTDLIAYIAGDYAKSVQVETFLSKHAGDQGFRQHELMGARFVHTHEPNAGALYDVSFMKTITGNDEQSTRTLNQGFIRWKPQCTPFVGSNNPIRFSTADDAMMNRQEAVLFVRGYDVPDAYLLERLKAEKNGILRLLIRYLEREHWDGLPDLPVSVIQLREQMAVATEDALDFVAGWIAEGRLRSDDTVPASRCIQVNTLYQQFRYWCEEAGERPCGRKTFSAVVGRKYQVVRSNGMRFSGLVA